MGVLNGDVSRFREENVSLSEALAVKADEVKDANDQLQEACTALGQSLRSTEALRHHCKWLLYHFNQSRVDLQETRRQLTEEQQLHIATRQATLDRQATRNADTEMSLGVKKPTKRTSMVTRSQNSVKHQESLLDLGNNEDISESVIVGGPDK